MPEPENVDGFTLDKVADHISAKNEFPDAFNTFNRVADAGHVGKTMYGALEVEDNRPRCIGGVLGYEVMKALQILD
jgi:hypothetical protein